jgi:hypothetical protein
VDISYSNANHVESIVNEIGQEKEIKVSEIKKIEIKLFCM